MPELPEVETTVRGINKYVTGHKIIDVWTNYGGEYHIGKDHIKDSSFFNDFKQKIIGAKVISASRLGKNVLIHLSNKWTILIHMKMTGHLLFGKYKYSGNKKDISDPWKPESDGPLSDPFNRFIRFILILKKGRSEINHLALSDMRRFAKVTIIKTEDLKKSLHLMMLGPEPLEKEFDLKKFNEQMLKRTKLPIKSALMNQELISGIGNIYSDEILWRSEVHPESLFNKIPVNKIKEIHKHIKQILKKGIDFGGDSMSDYRNIQGTKGEFQEHHQVYRRNKLHCYRKECGGKIERKVIKGRSSHFCPNCQKLYI